jgi:uncharacterized membrane protein (DUF485 family)
MEIQPKHSEPAAEVAGKGDFLHSEAFLAELMRRQLRLSIACGLAFALVLLAMPLLNYYAPGLMATRVGGFPLTWLILGVLFFPFVWTISWTFIRRSLAMEAQEAHRVLEGNNVR